MSTYAKSYYGVPADIGRRVIVDGRPGIIYRDGGQYIDVNFDNLKPGVCRPCHPTWKVEYLDMGTLRKMTRSQVRYQRFLDCGDLFDDFYDYLMHLEWERKEKAGGEA